MVKEVWLTLTEIQQFKASCRLKSVKLLWIISDSVDKADLEAMW